jgi:hypothetical protein
MTEMATRRNTAKVGAQVSATVTPIAAGKKTPRRQRCATEIFHAARDVFLEKGF